MKFRMFLGGILLTAGLMTGVLVWHGDGAAGEAAQVAEVQFLTKAEPDTESNPVSAASQPEPLTLHALSAVLMDGDSGRILYGKDAEVFRPMASTTKIMTCILALENGNLTDVCTVSETAAAQPKVHLGAGKGRQFYLKDLLYSLMLESHNDSAVMIAEQVGGSVENFSSMMNQKARDIGCKDTFFLTPNGLDASVTAPDGTEYTHGTTAEDLAKILRYCIMESPVREQFLEITRTATYSFSDVEGKRSYSCMNHNAFLTMMDGALTGKTGFTGGAGYSYVGALSDEGRTYIIALLGSGWPPHKTYKWADAKTLFQYGAQKYHYRDVFEEINLKPVPVENGIAGNPVGKMKNPVKEQQVFAALSLRLSEEERHLNLLLRDEEQVETKVKLPDTLTAPVRSGDVAGHVTYLLDGQVIRTYPVYADSSVQQRNLVYCMQQIWYLFFLPG